MNNYHRRTWTLDFIDPADPLAELYGVSGTREFWFEPYVSADENALRFKVQFQPNQMSANWNDITLKPNGGTKPYDPDADPTDETEALVGEIKIGGSVQPLNVYLDKTGMGTKQVLTILIGRTDSAPSGTGIATAQD